MSFSEKEMIQYAGTKDLLGIFLIHVSSISSVCVLVYLYQVKRMSSPSKGSWAGCLFGSRIFAKDVVGIKLSIVAISVAVLF